MAKSYPEPLYRDAAIESTRTHAREPYIASISLAGDRPHIPNISGKVIRSKTKAHANRAASALLLVANALRDSDSTRRRTARLCNS